MSDATTSLSSEPDSREGKGFVLDFLYQDARRVGSFLAQIDPEGHVQELKRTRGIEDAGGSATSISANANAVVARGAVDVRHNESKLRRRMLEQTIDPFWSNAISLLSLLDERGLLHRDASTASMGNFVLIRGLLGIFDFSLLKIVWQTPELRSAYETATALGFRNSDGFAGLTEAFFPKLKNNPERAAREFGRMLSDILKSQSETLHGRLQDAESKLFYFMLNDTGMVSTPAELFQKHGYVIAGEWSVLGILDAVPGPTGLDALGAEDPFGLKDNPLTLLLSSVQAMTRQAGKPESAYGVSPLLIYRSAGE